ncbi:DUF2878 domain-containing protein [Psychrosphaera algicola]|uniref:DUF2878 domain-containing protein n=1 Tax=Psychrosphaera algicola TaxID=3023714 RepID=A0ABT5FEF5_9GAMM|nr:DUF2878 domain-containing protein [Psychrosphaera sp. G1-22]MDC2889936.1 DUF2878 domain-containing protein [Psychrosphaera sp. G1-22]
MFNIIWFQVNWFGLIAYQTYFVPISILSICLHLYLNKAYRRADIKLALIVTASGCIIETLMIQLGIISFDQFALLLGFLPFWLVVLWTCFALTLNHSMKFFAKHPLLAVICGSLFGPLSYLAGIELGAATSQVKPFLLFLSYSFVWGLSFGVFTRLIVDHSTRQGGRYASSL